MTIKSKPFKPKLVSKIAVEYKKMNVLILDSWIQTKLLTFIYQFEIVSPKSYTNSNDNF